MSGLKGVRKSEALTDIYLWHILTYKSIGLLSKRRCGAKHIWKVKKLKTRQRRSTWKSGCRKSARRCGAKHRSKQTITKQFSFGALLGPESWDVKLPSQNVQNTTFLEHFGSWDVEEVHAVVARNTFGSQNVAEPGQVQQDLRPFNSRKPGWGVSSAWLRSTLQKDLWKQNVAAVGDTTEAYFGLVIRRHQRKKLNILV